MIPRARNSDPAQSHQAAAQAAFFAPSHADRILTALRLHGPMTAHELERYTGLTAVQIDRRAAEMRRAMQIKARTFCGIEQKRYSPAGVPAQVWEAIDA